MNAIQPAPLFKLRQKFLVHHVLMHGVGDGSYTPTTQVVHWMNPARRTVCPINFAGAPQYWKFIPLGTPGVFHEAEALELARRYPREGPFELVRATFAEFLAQAGEPNQ